MSPPAISRSSPTGKPNEQGQVLVLALIFIVVVLLGMAAMVIDVGYAYYAHRSLQSSADASALAEASGEPDGPTANAVPATRRSPTKAMSPRSAADRMVIVDGLSV